MGRQVSLLQQLSAAGAFCKPPLSSERIGLCIELHHHHQLVLAATKPQRLQTDYLWTYCSITPSLNGDKSSVLALIVQVCAIASANWSKWAKNCNQFLDRETHVFVANLPVAN